MTQEILEGLADKASGDAGLSELNRLAVLADIALSLRRIAASLEGDNQKKGPKKIKATVGP